MEKGGHLGPGRGSQEVGVDVIDQWSRAWTGQGKSGGGSRCDRSVEKGGHLGPGRGSQEVGVDVIDQWRRGVTWTGQGKSGGEGRCDRSVEQGGHLDPGTAASSPNNRSRHPSISNKAKLTARDK